MCLFCYILDTDVCDIILRQIQRRRSVLDDDE